MSFGPLAIVMLCGPTVYTTAEAKRSNTLFNYGCHLVFHKPHLYSASSARQELQFTTLSDRRKFHTTCVTVQVFELPVSTVPDTPFDTPSTHHNIHASTMKQFNIPVTSSSFGQITGALAWRSLPSHVRVSIDFPTFCKLYN